MDAAGGRFLMAVIYEDGIAADRFLSELGYGLRQKLAVRGLVQRNTFRRDRTKCDMELEELGSGQVFQLSQDRGKFAGGCRLDRSAIVAASKLIEQGLEAATDLLIINKFGRTEAEGRGLREAICMAIEKQITTIVGVPRRNVETWLEFSGDFSDRCEISDTAALHTWIRNRIPAVGLPFAGIEKAGSPLLLSEFA